jgi:SAM-dependent methyltransferase
MAHRFEQVTSGDVEMKTVDAIRAAARREMDRVTSHLNRAEDRSGKAPALVTTVPVPLPEGWSESELRESMLSLSIDASPPGALSGYVGDSFWRFLHTWGLVRQMEGRALELGANPYFTTWMLRRFTTLDVTLSNYFGEDDEVLHEQIVTVLERSNTASYPMKYRSFNLETDPFPFEDGEFDLVLFCEIIEHLLVDPLHALREINRTLKPGGTLVLTTPNVGRLECVLRLITGENIYHPYSGHGPYGRHNREYMPHEIVRLLAFAGFTVESAFTADAHLEPCLHHPLVGVVGPLLADRSTDLGQYLFVRARAERPTRTGRPRWLYQSWPDAELVDE